MPNRPSPISSTPIFSLREEFFQPRTFSRVLALAVINGAVVTGDAAPPSPTPVPADPETKTKPGSQLPEVVVTADSYNPPRASSPKYPEPLLDTPQSISIISRKVMDDQNAVSLRDVIRNVPGITIQAGEGGARPGDNFIIRGFSARTDTYVDGVRDVNGFYRDPFNFEQVEVTKGPASVYSGRGSTGGSINIVTKTPTPHAFYSGTAGIGTDEYYRGTLDINQPIRFGWDHHENSVGGKEPAPLDTPSTAFRLNALWHTNDVPGRDDANFTRWGIAPSLAFGLGTSTQLTLSYLHLQQDNMPDFGLPWVTATNNALLKYRNEPAPVNFSNYYGLNQRDHEKLRTDEFMGILKHGFSDSASARYTLHYGRNSRDSIISAPRFISNDSTNINREFQSRDEIDTVLTNQLDFNFNVATFGFEHAINIGAEYTHETFQNRLRLGPAAPLADLYNPNVNDYFAGPVRRTGAVNESDTDTVGVYLFDTIKLGEHWLLSGGVRGDYFDADYDVRSAAGVMTHFHRRDRMVSWRGALMYKPVSIGSIYFAAGSSFNPSAEDFALTAATAELGPEKTTTYELGTKWDVLDKRLSLSAAVFYTLKENARTPGLTPSDPVTVLEGEQKVMGFEFEVKGNLTPNWEVIGGYTYLDSQIKKSNTPAEVGNELPGVPRNAVSFWTTYQLPWNIEVGAGAQWVDQRFANLINTRSADSYYTVDAMAAYKVTDNFTVRVNAYNITDEEYISGLHIQGSFGHFIPGPGRSATITASLKF
jgi:catecholate siderophore receptor